MSDNKKFIIFLSWSTGVSLVVAYIFSVLEVNNAFVSDEFFFALFSGVFASFFVMLLSEIKRYIDAKRLAEDALYGLLLKMYIELMGEVGNASMFLQNKERCTQAHTSRKQSPAEQGFEKHVQGAPKSTFWKIRSTCNQYLQRYQRFAEFSKFQ